MKLVSTTQIFDLFRRTFVPPLEARSEEKVTPLQRQEDRTAVPVIRYRSAWINVRRLLEEEDK